jgi:hypothetical protein
MKKIFNRKKIILIVASFSIIALSYKFVLSWGEVGHKFINRYATLHIPGEMKFFKENAQFLSEHSIDADNRKKTEAGVNEPPKHYIDIDNFEEFFKGKMPRNLDSLYMKYGKDWTYKNGVIPWATVWTMDSLTNAIKRKDLNKILLFASDLGHYVGDAHQPLHTTKFYDGKKDGKPFQEGIHRRYESHMIQRFVGEIKIDSVSSVYVNDPINYVFKYIENSYSYLDELYRADSLAKIDSKGNFDDVYYASLWKNSKDFTKKQIQIATQDLANLWFTCWINAGKPKLGFELIKK